MKSGLFLSCILLMCVSGAPAAQTAAEPSFLLKSVGPNVWAAISNPKSTAPAGANTGFVIGDEGVVVIDTTVSADADGPPKTAAIRSLPPYSTTPRHRFVDAGAVVLAHRNVRGWVHSENLRMFGTETAKEGSSRRFAH